MRGGGRPEPGDGRVVHVLGTSGPAVSTQGVRGGGVTAGLR